MITTLRIPLSLKRRINKIAASEDRSAHNFILEAITQHAARAEKYAAFVKEAEAASEATRAGARTYSIAEVREALERRRDKRRQRSHKRPGR